MKKVLGGMICKGCADKAKKRDRIDSDLKALEKITPTRYRPFMDQEVKPIHQCKDGAFISGKVGSGKTCLALQIAKWAVNQGKGSVLRHSVPSAMAILKDFKNKNMLNEMKKLTDAPILILDDLGTEKKSEYANEMLYGILNHRNEWNRYTLITSNCGLGELDDRIASRIVQMCDLINLDGDDRRITNGK